MNLLKSLFVRKRKNEIAKPQLRLKSSVFPEVPSGISSTELFNSTWRHISREANEHYRSYKQVEN